MPVHYDRTVRLVDESGNLINVGNPLPTTGGGGGGGGGASQADKSAFTSGVSLLTPIGGYYSTSPGTDPVDNSAVAILSTIKRALHVNLRSDAGIELGTLANPVRVNPMGSMTAVIDTNNSTTTPLGISASFTGGWTEVLAYAAVSVNALSDQSSASNGVELQFSHDGVNIANRELAFLPGSGVGTGKVLFSPIRARYFRFKYLNGTIAQTNFQVQALLHSHPALPVSDAINADGKSTAAAVIPVASYLHVFNGATWDRVRGNQISITLYSSIARLATPAASATQNNYASGGTVLFLNVTAAPVSPGSGGLQVFFEAQDTLTGVWSRLNAIPVLVTTAGSYLYVIGAGAVAPQWPQSGNRVVQAAGLPLPRTWRAQVVHLDGQSYTYSASHQYVQ